jgi:putative ABC transport system ATP-binding protein
MLMDTETARETRPIGARQTAEQTPSDVLIRTEELWKTYVMGDEEIHALRGVSFEIRRGEYVAIIGPSGSGKSTLMNMIGCLDTPSKGEYWLNGKLVSQMDDDELARIRNKEIGFVFQTFNLLPRATVELGHRMTHRPNELSGGQRQRVAIARALVNNPSIILADEPTGNLDSKTSEEIMKLIETLHERGNTIILVTHEPDVARHAHRIISLFDGGISSDEQIR